MSEESVRVDLENHTELAPLLDVDKEGRVVCFGWVSPIYGYLREEDLLNSAQEEGGWRESQT